MTETGDGDDDNIHRENLAVLGLPVPEVKLRGPSASAVILADRDSAELGYEGLAEALAEYSLKLLIDAMEVAGLSGKFKLGQDENDATLHAILAALPDDATVAWVKRFNAGR